MSSNPAFARAGNQFAHNKALWDQVIVPERYAPSQGNDGQIDEYGLKFLLVALQKKKQEVLDEMGALKEELRNSQGGRFADESDRAAHEEQSIKDAARNGTHRKLLDKIGKAERKILSSAPGKSSEYGYCEDTGEPIELNRLINTPWTTRTLEAQDAHEKTSRYAKLGGNLSGGRRVKARADRYYQ